MQPGLALQSRLGLLGSAAAGVPRAFCSVGMVQAPCHCLPNLHTATRRFLSGGCCYCLTVVVHRHCCLPLVSCRFDACRDFGVLSGSMLPRGTIVPVQHRDVAAIT
jgi:hypothetical protein